MDDKCDEETFLDATNTEINFGDTYAIDNKSFCVAQTDKLKVETMRIYKGALQNYIDEIFQDVRVLRKGEAPVTEYGYQSLKESREFI